MKTLNFKIIFWDHDFDL